MKDEEWIFDDRPKKVGWYAVSYCWELYEGIFPGASYWDGEIWNPELPIFGYQGPFLNEELSKEWAYAHDYGGIIRND
jgi:hypothetical protein